MVDSSRFLSKPKPVQVDERGFFENKELTKVHQRLHQNLKRATSQEPCVGTPLGCAVQIYIIYHYILYVHIIYYTYIYIVIVYYVSIIVFLVLLWWCFWQTSHDAGEGPEHREGGKRSA